MIHPYEWAECRLLLTVRNRHGQHSFLLDQVPQQEFMQHWLTMWESDRDRKIVEISMLTLDKDSYDLLEPSYTGNYILE